MGIAGLGTPTVPSIAPIESHIAIGDPVEAPELPVVKTSWTPQELEQLVREKAVERGLDVHAFVETARCESSHFIDPKIQSGHYKNGVRETSFGIFQFNLPSGLKTRDGRTITYEIAVDPVEATDAAAYNFELGLAHHWSCWKSLK